MTGAEAGRLVLKLALRLKGALRPCRLVVGLSGGADSTLVLLVALKLKELEPLFEVVAVHCIHGLDADDPVWLAHNQKLCAKLGVELKTPKLHIVYGQGRSPEEVSRQERYKALISEVQDGVLLLGHQADDQVENFLLALKRGSGPYGLSGMRFKLEDERGCIVRPLLQLHKAQIEEALQALDIPYVYDISNSYLKFERNFMRLKVLPLLRERFTGIDEAVLRSAYLCGCEHDLAMRYAQEKLSLALCERGLDLQALPLEDEALMLCVLRLFLCRYIRLPPEYALLQEVLNLCRIGADQSGLVHLEELQVRRYRHYLCVIRALRPPVKRLLSLKAGEQVSNGDYLYRLSETSDPALGFALSGTSVTLLFYPKGSLRVHPVSRTHSRELKKVMGEFEVPYWERCAQCLVLDAGVAVALGSLCALRTAHTGREGTLYRLEIMTRAQADTESNLCVRESSFSLTGQDEYSAD
ncbi:MAG: tRNA lysidine(34) synthetase TilS [Succinivibrio sp.]|nr:tRNA lysidine(34) synthetase TilS [Succinivibrio sp.]